MKKALIITYYWPPSGGAGVQRWLKFVKYLPEFGVEPIVLTVNPLQASYPQFDASLLHDIAPSVRVERTPTFELYGLYKRLTGKQEIPYGGFANETSPTFIQRVGRAIRGNFFLPDPRRGWNRYAIKRAKTLIRELDITTVITTGPPHSTHLIGLKLRRKFCNIKWIADFRDPWTDIYYYNKFPRFGWAKSLDRTLECKVLNNADHLLTVSDDFARLLTEKVKTGHTLPYSVIPNGYDAEDFHRPAPATDTARYVITYVGTISDDYDLSGLLAAFDLLSPDVRRQVQLRFVGKVPLYIAEQLNERIDVDLVGFVSHPVAVGYLLQSDMQLLVIPKVKGNSGIMPGKLLEYIASGKPALAIGPHGCDAEILLAETHCGQVFDYHEAQAMADYIQKGIDGAIERPSKTAIAMFSRRSLTGKLSKIIIDE
ncbi:MAG: glycosyltransferase family 4 protein [Bacteroidales bacterium]|jgi:glycosyltransferase involved in cell wall biosynthesis|nr:glycosyltransferase family 4 protein [Bacteroidales bacterium]